MPSVMEGDVFLVSESASPIRPALTALAPHLCRNEEAELQRLLVHNLNLLPSRQIVPDKPPRWLLVQKEMPIPDPDSGVNRWSLDVLFVDHLAIPTLVECKRMQDTRSRREVVAQMIEYAANGHHYWDAADLQARAQTCAGSAEALHAWVRANTTMPDAENFFAQVQANLSEAKTRLIFFLEQAPPSLPSLVDFMNKQLNTTEVLLVEARQYRIQGREYRIIVPRLFGYTEQARAAKRESRQEVAKAMGVGGLEAFTASWITQNLPAHTQTAMRTLLAAWEDASAEQPFWKFLKTANLVLPQLHPSKSWLNLDKCGRLSFMFGYWNPQPGSAAIGGGNASVTPQQQAAHACLLAGLQRDCSWQFTEQQLHKFPSLKPGEWEHKTQQLIALINSL